MRLYQVKVRYMSDKQKNVWSTCEKYLILAATSEEAIQLAKETYALLSDRTFEVTCLNKHITSPCVIDVPRDWEDYS